MNTQEKYNAITNAMEYTGENPAQGTRAEIYLIKGDTEKDIKDLFLKIIYDENVGGVHDLGYEIVSRACDVISELSLEDLESSDCIYDLEEEHASVYTAERLSYLNQNNQDEITEKQKEYDCDIQTACAVWYDAMVKDTADTLRDYIITE